MISAIQYFNFENIIFNYTGEIYTELNISQRKYVYIT